MFSHIFNKAREWGYVALQNPCQAIKGFKEVGRSRYMTDAEFDQAKAYAHFTVVYAMDLALLIGQRLGVEVTGELAAVIDRINERPRLASARENGQRLTQYALRSRFDKARTLAKADFQFRDIRAKAATDTSDLAHSQSLLGRKNKDMTEHYVKARSASRTKPLR